MKRKTERIREERNRKDAKDAKGGLGLVAVAVAGAGLGVAGGNAYGEPGSRQEAKGEGRAAAVVEFPVDSGLAG